jgi:cellulose synthase/poly-beta-1,6-N-acetylglucosamine synthase-like glycosyltransferase
VIVVEEDTAARLLDSTIRLQEEAPHLSSLHLGGIRRLVLLVAVIAAPLLFVSPGGVLIVATALSTAAYAATVTHRLFLFRASIRPSAAVVITDSEARAVPARSLPLYTVLIPAYREPQVIADLLASIDALEYPTERLDVKLILEQDDEETIAAVETARPGGHVQVLLVPPSQPRTKPKALNYGLTYARGELVTIYDAEDRPDPLQLRRAVVAFSRSDPSVACFQAKLAFDNIEDNLITRWFAAEYAMWFNLYLPGLVAEQAPLPLGGTSNHFRRAVLESVAAWDCYNVTEDADLGIRLHRRGWRVAMLESTTYEEANTDFVNWVKQRSRWYKGYLQTWAVHMRHPRTLWRQLGPRGFLHLNLFMGGTPLLSFLNPIFWSLVVVWFIAMPHLIRQIYPAPIFYTALLCFAFGNFAVFYMTLLGARLSNRPRLVLASLLVPLYWMMMAIAAIKAVVQFVATPSLWEKTAHGLSTSRERSYDDVLSGARMR